MERIRVVAREGEPAPEEPSGGGSHEAPRSRLRRALLCPFCRDEVTRKGAVICARRGCGALYHRECWDECATQYGGCAIYGCESKKSREVSAVGWLLRLVRLVVATVLFPPRALSALREREGKSLFRVLLEAFNLRKILTQDRGLVQLIFMTFAGIFASGFAVAGTFRLVERWPGFEIPIILAVVILSPLAIVTLFGLIYEAGALVASALRGELAALERADAGGGSVLGRLRRGDGKK